jgi:hypothetical protein
MAPHQNEMDDVNRYHECCAGLLHVRSMWEKRGFAMIMDVKEGAAKLVCDW